MDNIPHTHQAALARHEDLVVQELPEEIMVYDLKRHKAHCLNKTAAFIWYHCDGQTTVPEITKLLYEEVRAPIDEEMVWYALDKLGQAHLLEAKLAPPTQVKLTRRRIVGKLGVGALLAVPVIMSITSPTAAQGASAVTVNCQAPATKCFQHPTCRNLECCCNTTPRRRCNLGGCTGALCVAAGNAPCCSQSSTPPVPC